MLAQDIREAFCKHFVEAGHRLLPAASLVPEDDPSLLFTNAGMVPFKDIFCGNRPPPRGSNRAVSIQPCVRAGGKHNDLENVGYSPRHHTFFEMLGNFSFGAYFKEEAISLAWQFVTQGLSLPKERLWVSVHKDDDDSEQLWRRIADMPSSRIVRLGEKDNFWSMGDVGPCGPCSEIFFDHGEAYDGKPPSESYDGGERFVEIWNLVFMQYQRDASGQRTALSQVGVDTGMGLERITAVMQGVHDNYQTDLFTPLLQHVAADSDDRRHAARVLADHSRSACFLLASGVMPSNEGRGYVLRRILRRALRYEYQLCADESEPSLLLKMADTVVAQMSRPYPFLADKKNVIMRAIDTERQQFSQTLARGLALLDEVTAGLKRGDQLSGDKAFMLYDTYGFPLDLTADALRGRSITIEQKGFDEAMAQQKSRARRAHASRTGAPARDAAVLQSLPPSEFVGYGEQECRARIVGLLDSQQQRVDAVSAGDVAAVLLDKTPFYAERGGQESDSGLLLAHPDTPVFAVAHAQAVPSNKQDAFYVVHEGTCQQALRVGQDVSARIDGTRRLNLCQHHSATHIVHEALRQVLGEHVAQKGSKVAAHRLRFDFSHPQALSLEEWHAVGEQANTIIMQDEPVTTKVMGYHEAVNSGARALFGERYGDKVRVVFIGKRPDDTPYSVELCGGTHVASTGVMGSMVLLAQSAVSAGVRRIEAVVGLPAWQTMARCFETHRSLAQLLGSSDDAQMVERVTHLLAQAQHTRKKPTDNVTLHEAVREGALVYAYVDGAKGNALKTAAETLQKQHEAQIAVALNWHEGQVSYVVKVTDSAGDGCDARKLADVMAQTIDGRSGGRQDMAQGGGKGQKGDIERMLAALKTHVKQG